MNLQHLKNLSQKRIINMKRIYEDAGLSTSSMNSRISTMNGSLSTEEREAIALAVATKIEEIVLTLEIDNSQIANALGITEYDIRRGEPVWPCAYLETPTGDDRPIYLPEDKIKRRDAAAGSGDPLFWQAERIAEGMVKNAKVQPTERGQGLFNAEQEGEGAPE